MHNTTTFCRILLWIVLVLVCAVQIMTIVSIQINNANAIEGEAYDKVLSIVPLIVAAVLLLGGAVLFEVFPKRGYIGLILCAVAGIIFFIYAFSIRDAFPVHIGSDGKDTGVTTARMIWRAHVACIRSNSEAGRLASRAVDGQGRTCGGIRL